MNKSSSMFVEKDKEKGHYVTMEVRRSLFIGGVTDVINFDEQNVEMDTVCGLMMVEGEGLKVSALDVEKGEVCLNGMISSVYYSEKRAKTRKGLFGKNYQ